MDHIGIEHRKLCSEDAGDPVTGAEHERECERYCEEGDARGQKPPDSMARPRRRCAGPERLVDKHVTEPGCRKHNHKTRIRLWMQFGTIDECRSTGEHYAQTEEKGSGKEN